MMNRPIDEQDEFLLSRLLDNDLSADEAAVLRARMEREPELRKTYEAMTRIESLLTARRVEQPQVNWSQFHRQVMDQIAGEAARRRTIRLADLLRVALPLAAAAAIALLVWFWPHGRIAPGGGVPTQQMAESPKPQPPTHLAGGPERDSVITIRFNRPDTPDSDNVPPVTFARSDELAKQYELMDERNRSREPGRVLLAGNVRSTESVIRNLSEASPLF